MEERVIGGLKRKYYLGIFTHKLDIPVCVGDLCKYQSVFIIKKVQHDSPAKKAGLLVGDLILGVENKSVEEYESLQKMIEEHNEKSIQLVIGRKDNIFKTTISLQLMPLESDEHIVIEYGSFKIEGVGIRTIITKPKSTNLKQKYPCILFIQGINCDSIDIGRNKEHPYRKILYGLTNENNITIRVERFGIGDSEGKACKDMSFHDEIELFEAALLYVSKLPQVDERNIILFGYSLGGVIAPVIATHFMDKVKGLIIFGTFTAKFSEYCITNMIRQYKMKNIEHAQFERDISERQKIVELLLDKKCTPQEIIRHNPQYTKFFLKDRYFFGRNYKFYQQLEEINILQYWRQVIQPVLLIAGKNDCAIDLDENIRLYRLLKKTDNCFSCFLTPPIDHRFNKTDDGKFAEDVLYEIVTYLNRII